MMEETVYIFEIIAERKIREAMERGDFDNLPNRGKPLPPDGLDRVPPDLRIAYKIMKNAHILPEELELRKSILNLQKLLDACCDDEEQMKLQKKLNEKQLRYNMLMEMRFKRAVDPFYQKKIMEKLERS
jgi:hypothetical protein